jgi:SulP family sulfate permease
MIALGMAKIGSAFFGSLIPAGSFNRSILNIKAGAKTQFSNLVAAAIILFTLLFLTPIVYYLPQAVIAAIIVYSVYFLFDVQLIINLWKTDRKESLLLLITALVTLLLGFVEGIVFGLTCSLVFRYLFFKKG